MEKIKFRDYQFDWFDIQKLLLFHPYSGHIQFKLSVEDYFKYAGKRIGESSFSPEHIEEIMNPPIVDGKVYMVDNINNDDYEYIQKEIIRQKAEWRTEQIKTILED